VVVLTATIPSRPEGDRLRALVAFANLGEEF
jgi:hypothetical protein